MKGDNRERCPVCGTGIKEHLPEGSRYTCAACGNRFLLKWDKDQRDYVFVNLADRGKGEPLGLPRGSVRASVMLLISLLCWLLFLLGRDVPHYLLNVVLIMIGYYFAFRGTPVILKGLPKVETKDSKDPLYMPKGVIRWVVIGGFVVAFLALTINGNILDHDYIEFFFILFGLVGGYTSKKIRTEVLKMETPAIMKHGRSVVVLLISLTLFTLFLGGWEGELGAVPVRISIAVIGFYFGSRD
ncbi:MAG: hypothetical protein ACMUIE_05160 [Thermoplasmatota archaeon]